MSKDLSRGAFAAALKRNGFRKVIFWIDRPDKPGLSVGVVMNRDNTINRRASLAHAIREFAKWDAEAAAEQRARDIEAQLIGAIGQALGLMPC